MRIVILPSLSLGVAANRARFYPARGELATPSWTWASSWLHLI